MDKWYRSGIVGRYGVVLYLYALGISKFFA